MHFFLLLSSYCFSYQNAAGRISPDVMCQTGFFAALDDRNARIRRTLRLRNDYLVRGCIRPVID